jgi:hypothetical protein
MASLVVSALSTWSNKGLNKAEKDISAFDKTVKNLGKTFAGVFSAQAIFQFGKAAVKAFMDDEKAAKSLEVQLNNLGFSFAAPGVELYIKNLERMYGVLADDLRPGFQTLITASGSLTKSQEALNVALDVSAATGRSVQQVSAALARGFAGQTTALSRLGAGIDKATLASGDMNKIMALLQAKFSGQASARLDTYAGKMALLTVATEDFKDEIGKGILDALSILGKDQSIETATHQMDNFGKSIGDAIYGVGVLISKLDGLVAKASGGNLAKLLLFLTPSGLQLAGLFNFLSTTGANERNKPSSNFTYSLGSSAAADIARVKELDLLKKRNQVAASLLAKDKEKLGLAELEKKFDLERIGLTTALNYATDEETKLRIKAQLALLDQNDVLAKKYNAELEAANAAKKLADAANEAAGSLRNVYENARDYGAFRELPSYISGVPSSAPVPMGSSGPSVQNNYFEIKPQGSILTQDDFTDQVQKSMQKIVTNGYITAPAGFL